MPTPALITDEILERVRQLLGELAGAPVELVDVAPAASGWSAAGGSYPWLSRLTVTGWGDPSVVVKTRRPADHWRDSDTTVRERAALTLLQERGSRVAPRLLAADHALGFVLLEDLGAGPAVEDVLLGSDPVAATAAVVAHAVALAELQEASVGESAAFYDRLPQEFEERLDRVCVQVMPFRERWRRLRALTDARPELPAADRAEADVERIWRWLDGAGDLLALSNGDFMPQNSRLLGGAVRLLDFEGAVFQHVLLDAAQLRVPYAAAPAWSRLPPEVSRLAEQAYRERLVASCPRIGDERVFAEGMAAATSAWAVNRLTRLERLEERDRPHPLGYSRRGQLLDLLQTAFDSCVAAETLPDLRAWFEGVSQALRRRWPEVAEAQPYYPAFRSAGTTPSFSAAS